MKKLDLKKLIFSFSFIFLILFSCFSLGFNPAKAESSSSGKYTTALEDLRQGEGFSEEDFPLVEDNHSLKVISIAESEDKELFIYVYQPSAFREASSINISTAINDSLKYNNYKLELLNKEGVFQKYKVKDFTVKDDALRYYDIPSIFSPYNTDYDASLPEYNENLISEAVFDVSKLYTASTVNGEVSYTCKEQETVLITKKYVGFLDYENGFELFPGAHCRSHYVAFSSDHDIEKLLEAEVYFITQSVHASYYASPFTPDITYTRGEEIETYKTLKYDEEVEHEGSGWFAKTYKWNRIESLRDFASEEGLTNEELLDLADMQWVLRFTETTVQTSHYGEGWDKFYTDVKDVTILRLKFETEGKTYNLGVVDNKQWQDGLQLPGNLRGDCSNFTLMDLLILIGLVILALILIPFLPDIIKLVAFLIKYTLIFLFYIIKYSVLAVYYVLASPVYLIKWIRARKE